MRRILFTFAFFGLFQGSVAQDLLSQKKAERYYQGGIDLLGRSEFGGARNSFEEFLRIAPAQSLQRADAEYYRAQCALALYHTDGVLLMEQFRKAHPENSHLGAASFDLGNFYYAGKNYTKAIASYGQLDFSSLSAEQQNNGHFRWGYSLFNQKKLKESLDQFNAIKLQGGAYGPASSYYAGFIEYTLGNYADALADLKRAEQSPSYAKIVPYLIANVYYRQKNYEELLRYRTALQNSEGISNPDEIALLAAEAYFKKSDFTNALAGYQQYLTRKDNADRGVVARAGFAAFSTGQNNLALDYFKATASDNDSVGFYSSYYLGLLYLKQQQKPLALTAFGNARKFAADPAIVEESAYQFAKISFDVGQSEQAIRESERFLSVFPASTHALEMRELLSQAYTDGNNYNKAIAYIESLPKRSPVIDRAFQKATYLKGAELFNKEDYAQAVFYFGKSLQNPIDRTYMIEANFWSGEAYSVGKKYALAIPCYEHLVTMADGPDENMMMKTRYALGYAFYNQQQYDRALTNFREFVNKAPAANPNYADGVIRLADCYYVTKAYPAALENYQKAIRLNAPDIDYAYLQEGIIMGIQRKYGEAATELNQVVARYPKSRYLDDVMFQLAQFDFEQGHYDDAVIQFGKIIASAKPSRFLPYAYQRRAASYYNLKDYSKTADDYISVVDKFPSHPITKGVLIPLQEALILAGRSGEFSNYMAQFKAATPDAKGVEGIEFEAAKNLYFNQDYQNAIAGLENFIRSYPQSQQLTEANYYKAESMYRLKDSAGALAIYQQIASDDQFAFANKVTARIAELQFKAGQYEKAIPGFQKLARIATTKKDLFNAWSGLMESYFFLAQYDSTDAYAKLILEKGKVNAGAENKASLYLGKTAMARGDYEGAKDEFLSTLNNAQDEYGAEAKYSLAELFYQNKEYKQCYETLVSLNKDFAAYSDWVGKSYLLLADDFLAMNDSFQAKGTLKSLIDNFPSPAVKEQAKEKLKKLEDDEARKKADVKPDTTTTH
jgi:tetratricopeptide (TPR) repeat protein